MRHFKASLQNKNNAKPVFCKHWSVPFAIRVDWEGAGSPGRSWHLEEGQQPWVSCTHCTSSKSDGRIRLWGVYKAAVNQSLEVDQYPLSKLDDFVCTSGRRSKILPSWTCLRLTSRYSWTSIHNHTCMSPSTPIRASNAILDYPLVLLLHQPFFSIRWTPFCREYPMFSVTLMTFQSLGPLWIASLEFKRSAKTASKS